MNGIENVERLLREEIVRVVGCTEPASVAFALAHAQHLLGVPFDPRTMRAELALSCDVMRNASTAVVPFLNQRGLRTVAAAGLSSAADEFNLFSSVNLDHARQLLAQKAWLHTTSLAGRAFFVKASLCRDGASVSVVLRGRHDRISSVERNGKTIKTPQFRAPTSLKLSDIFEIVQRRDRNLENQVRAFLIGQVRGDESTALEKRLSSLIRDRMCGSPLPVMTVTGSGNQGLFLGVPFYELYTAHGDSVLPAALLSLLVQIYQSEKKQRISGQCGLAEKAAPALASGWAFYRGAGPAQIEHLMKSVCLELHGMKCHGALAGCGRKAEKSFRVVMRQVNELVSE